MLVLKKHAATLLLLVNKPMMMPVEIIQPKEMILFNSAAAAMDAELCALADLSWQDGSNLDIFASSWRATKSQPDAGCSTS